jgi:hypothetical protein
MTPTWRWVALGACALAGCATTSTASTATTAEVRRDAVVRAATSDAHAPAVRRDPARPKLRNTGSDYVAIFQSLERYRRWLQAHPDPALVPTIWVDGTPVAQRFRTLLTKLRRTRTRWIDVDDRTEARVVSVVGDVVSLLVDEHTTGVRLLDEAGNVVDTAKQGPVLHLVVLLQRDARDGRWRIASVDQRVTNDVEVAL